MNFFSGIGAWLPLSFVRFRFSISLLSLLLFLFHSLPVSASQVASSVLPFRSRFPGFSPSFRPGFPCLLSGSVYSAFCQFPFILPCFAPTAVPQVIAWLCSPFGSLCFSISPFSSTFFRPLLFRVRLLSFRFFFSSDPLLRLTVGFTASWFRFRFPLLLFHPAWSPMLSVRF